MFLSSATRTLRALAVRLRCEGSFFFLIFATLGTSPRRPLRLELSDAHVYPP